MFVYLCFIHRKLEQRGLYDIAGAYIWKASSYVPKQITKKHIILKLQFFCYQDYNYFGLIFHTHKGTVCKKKWVSIRQ
jgi:hypothetical protein